MADTLELSKIALKIYSYEPKVIGSRLQGSKGYTGV